MNKKPTIIDLWLMLIGSLLLGGGVGVGLDLMSSRSLEARAIVVVGFLISGAIIITGAEFILLRTFGGRWARGIKGSIEKKNKEESPGEKIYPPGYNGPAPEDQRPEPPYSPEEY